MKGKVLKILIPVLCITVLVMALLIGGSLLLLKCAFSDSDQEVRIRYDGYFQYVIVGENSRYQDKNNKSLAIVGFTSSGMEQEAIDIPREIDGKIVEHIGLRDEGAFRPGGLDTNRYVHCSENLKKIYIHDNIKKMAFFYGSEVDIMVCSSSVNVSFDGGVLFKKIYIYKSLYDGANYSNSFSPANIVFMNNYSDEVNEGYYRLDNIEAGEKIPVPLSPERSGYEFNGWYSDPECKNVWDFNVSPIIEEDTEFRLYAGWRAL